MCTQNSKFDASRRGQKTAELFIPAIKMNARRNACNVTPDLSYEREGAGEVRAKTIHIRWDGKKKKEKSIQYPGLVP